MSTRDIKALADKFEIFLNDKKWSRRTRVNLHADSEDEAALLAYALDKRGWKTEVSSGLKGPIESLEPCWLVIVRMRFSKKNDSEGTITSRSFTVRRSK